MPVCSEARELFKAANKMRMEELAEIIDMCESPVEQMLLVALFNRWGGQVNLTLNRLQCYFGGDYPSYAGIFTACCEPQRTITTWEGNKYRVDFYVYLTCIGTRGSTPQNHHSPELVVRFNDTVTN